MTGSAAIGRIVVAKARFVVRTIKLTWVSLLLRSVCPTSRVTNAFARCISGRQMRKRSGKLPALHRILSGTVCSADARAEFA